MFFFGVHRRICIEAQKNLTMDVVDGYNEFLGDGSLIIGDKENITLFRSKRSSVRLPFCRYRDGSGQQPDGGDRGIDPKAGGFIEFYEGTNLDGFIDLRKVR